MAIIVEDGTGLANADAYVSVADVDAYHSARAQTAWTGATAAKEALIVRATQLVDASYAWRGVIASNTQALRWPRSGCIDRDGREIASDAIPIQIERAVSELALLLLGGSGVGGSFGGSATATGAVARVKAGSVEVEYKEGGIVAAPVGASGVLADGAGELLDRILAGLFNPATGPMILLGKS